MEITREHAIRARISERNLAVYKARMAGKTYAEVGRMFGISLERARQIVIFTRRKAEQSPEPINPADIADETSLEDIRHHFSVRAYNAIRNSGFETVCQLRQALSTKHGQKFLLSRPNLGRTSFHEVLDVVGAKDLRKVDFSSKVLGVQGITNEWVSGKMTSDEAMQKISQYLSKRKKP